MFEWTKEAVDAAEKEQHEVVQRQAVDSGCDIYLVFHSNPEAMRAALDAAVKAQGLLADYYDGNRDGYKMGRAEALEEAAKVCDSVNNFDNPMTATDCADAIRSLKPKQDACK